MLRASVLYAENDEKVHAVYCLRSEGITLVAAKRQVEKGSTTGVNTVEVIFKGSKGDQGREGAV